MKEHVTSLELSRKLEKLGCKQESEFYWVCFNDDKSESIKVWDLRNNHIGFKLFYSAFLASEIAESLPRGVEIETSKAYIHGSDISRWRCVLTYMNKKKIKMPMGFSETLVDALAEMKIYLLEHGLMEVGR